MIIYLLLTCPVNLEKKTVKFTFVKIVKLEPLRSLTITDIRAKLDENVNCLK